MPSNTNCPKCGGRMVEGFIIDNGYGATTVSAWHEGKPQKSVWTGIKRSKPCFKVATWRCGRCGFLESYAK